MVSVQCRCAIFYLLCHIFTVPFLCLDMVRYASKSQLKCDGTCAETRFRLSAKWTSPFKSARASVQLITGSQDVRISDGNASKGQLKCDGTCAETRFRLSVKQTSPFISAGASVQSITGSQGVRISDSNAGYTMF